MRLMVVQPVLASYRYPFFKEVSREIETEFWVEKNVGKGFDENYDKLKVHDSKIVEFFGKKIHYQKNIINGFFKFKPSVIFINANPRNITLWVLFALSAFKSVKIFIHGQGLYHKPKPSVFDRLIYRLLFKFCYRYIAYTNFSKDSLIWLGPDSRNMISVLPNTMLNRYPRNPLDDTVKLKKGILFIGRMRDGCNLDLLIDAVKALNDTGEDCFLHIIGSGEGYDKYKKIAAQNDNVIFYGKIYDARRISEISDTCLVGCYPGRAGLSVVHFMSLGLVPLVYSDISYHMGPEPSYINRGVNGSFFDELTASSIETALRKILCEPDLRNLRVEAYNTYLSLSTPSFSQKLIGILREGEFR